MRESFRNKSRKSPAEKLDEVIDRIIENSKEPTGEVEPELDGDDGLADLPEDVIEELRDRAFYFLPWPDGEYCAYARMLGFDTVQSEVQAVAYSVRRPEGELLSLSWPPGEKISLLQFQAAEDAGWAPLVDGYFEITYPDGFCEWAHTRFPANCEYPKQARVYSEFSPNGAVTVLRLHAKAVIETISQDVFDDRVEALWGLL